MPLCLRCEMAAADVAKYLYKPMVVALFATTAAAQTRAWSSSTSSSRSLCASPAHVAPSSRIAYWLAYRDPSSYFCSSTGARGSVRR
ncbi:uncharacterized protein [Aegilops tauschii subsp. strangulata]|uniref:uncharacterized protein isoform X3 n=1 Tax=Aegilops tauschii subsp. strangulata TaxID=200361 RepID=UPI003CC84772